MKGGFNSITPDKLLGICISKDMNFKIKLKKKYIIIINYVAKKKGKKRTIFTKALD